MSQKLRRLREALEAGGNQGSEVTTVAALMKRVLDDGLPRKSGRSVSTSTLETERWAATLWHQSPIAREKVANIRAEDVEAAFKLMRSRSGESLGLRSLKLIRSVLLRAMRDELARNGDARVQVALNSAAAARFPGSAVGPGAKTALSADEARRLLLVLKSVPNGLVFALSLVMGLRPGEAAGLRRSAIDLDRHLLYVETARRRTASGVEVTNGLKTRTSRRTLTMPESIHAWMSAHLAEHDALSKRLSLSSDLIFATPTGAPLDSSNSRRALRRACAQANVPIVAPNELRHSAATLLARDFPLHHVAQVLGHSVEVTDAYYWHRDRDTVTVHLNL